MELACLKAMMNRSFGFLVVGFTALGSTVATPEGAVQSTGDADGCYASSHEGSCQKLQVVVADQFWRAEMQHLHLLQLGSSHAKAQSSSGASGPRMKSADISSTGVSAIALTEKATQLQSQKMGAPTNLCDASFAARMVKFRAPACAEACSQICLFVESVLLRVQQGKSAKLAFCESSAANDELTSCALHHANVCNPSVLVEQAEALLGIPIPRTPEAFADWCGHKAKPL